MPGIGRADADGLVGQLSGQAFPVRLAVGHDRADAERSAGAQDSQSDLAAVRDQDLGEHQAFPTALGWRSARGPSSPSARSGGSIRTRLLPVLDRLAGLGKARADHAVDRRDNVLLDTQHVDPADAIRRP